MFLFSQIRSHIDIYFWSQTFAKILTYKDKKYSSLVTKAAKKCEVTVIKGQSLCLFKINCIGEHCLDA